jgi:Mn-dependent DtxR family transcriptional regulator
MGDICANRHKGNPFSIQAYKKAKRSAETTRRLILQTIKSYNGLTCEEIERLLDIGRSTVSARVSELKRDGYLDIIGKRKTQSGCNAAVYVAKKAKQQNLF